MKGRRSVVDHSRVAGRERRASTVHTESIIPATMAGVTGLPLLGRSSALTALRLRESNYLLPGPASREGISLFDARTAGRRPLTIGAGGAFHSAILRWIVSRALGVDSEHARVVRISSTLSRDTTDKLSDLLSHGQARIIAAMRSLGHTVGDHDGRRSQGSRVPATAASCGAIPGDYSTPSTRGEQDETARGTGG